MVFLLNFCYLAAMFTRQGSGSVVRSVASQRIPDLRCNLSPVCVGLACFAHVSVGFLPFPAFFAYFQIHSSVQRYKKVQISYTVVVKFFCFFSKYTVQYTSCSLEHTLLAF